MRKLCLITCAALLVSGGAAFADPAVDLCEHLVKHAIKARSTYQRADVTFGQTSDDTAFVRLAFDALSPNGYFMRGEATCTYDRVEPTEQEQAQCPLCAVYTFAGIELEGDKIDFPQPEPRISTKDSELPVGG